jgi:hypothetical protein
MNSVLNRLAERSTWQGLVALLGAFGVAVRPDLMEAVITFGLAAAGLANVLWPDNSGVPD